jgi:hypothetical protein
MTLNTLQLNELEAVYDTLAEALDQAGKDDEFIFSDTPRTEKRSKQKTVNRCEEGRSRD